MIGNTKDSRVLVRVKGFPDTATTRDLTSIFLDRCMEVVHAMDVTVKIKEEMEDWIQGTASDDEEFKKPTSQDVTESIRVHWILIPDSMPPRFSSAVVEFPSTYKESVLKSPLLWKAHPLDAEVVDEVQLAADLGVLIDIPANTEHAALTREHSCKLFSLAVAIEDHKDLRVFDHIGSVICVLPREQKSVQYRLVRDLQYTFDPRQERGEEFRKLPSVSLSEEQDAYFADRFMLVCIHHWTGDRNWERWDVDEQKTAFFSGAVSDFTSKVGQVTWKWPRRPGFRDGNLLAHEVTTEAEIKPATGDITPQSSNTPSSSPPNTRPPSRRPSPPESSPPRPPRSAPYEPPAKREVQPIPLLSSGPSRRPEADRAVTDASKPYRPPRGRPEAAYARGTASASVDGPTQSRMELPPSWNAHMPDGLGDGMNEELKRMKEELNNLKGEMDRLKSMTTGKSLEAFKAQLKKDTESEVAEAKGYVEGALRNFKTIEISPLRKRADDMSKRMSMVDNISERVQTLESAVNSFDWKLQELHEQLQRQLQEQENRLKSEFAHQMASNMSTFADNLKSLLIAAELIPSRMTPKLEKFWAKLKPAMPTESAPMEDLATHPSSPASFRETEGGSHRMSAGSRRGDHIPKPRDPTRSDVGVEPEEEPGSDKHQPAAPSTSNAIQRPTSDAGSVTARKTKITKSKRRGSANARPSNMVSGEGSANIASEERALPVPSADDQVTTSANAPQPIPQQILSRPERQRAPRRISSDASRQLAEIQKRISPEPQGKVEPVRPSQDARVASIQASAKAAEPVTAADAPVESVDTPPEVVEYNGTVRETPNYAQVASAFRRRQADNEQGGGPHQRNVPEYPLTTRQREGPMPDRSFSRFKQETPAEGGHFEESRPYHRRGGGRGHRRYHQAGDRTQAGYQGQLDPYYQGSHNQHGHQIQYTYHNQQRYQNQDGYDRNQ
ncbi:hypothetical protein HK104_007446 [Borealophlyctis nickersoniae]|nr:hypothetical protein HK104_007446 [Borealophlyctis nickersoniae]